MEEISKKIKELELKASKFDDFEENFKPLLNEIFELTEQIQNKLQEINPLFKVKSYSKPRLTGHQQERIEQLYNELKANDSMQITISDISTRFNIAESTAHKYTVDLRVMDGIQTRNDGRKIYFYYHKPKISKDEVELSEGTKIPQKFTFKS